MPKPPYVKVNSNISLIAQALPDLVAAVLERQTYQTERSARSWAPVDTGFLRNSSTSSVVGRGTALVVGEVTFHAYYAAYVNFGTGQLGGASKVPDRPSHIRYTLGWRGMRAMPYLSLAAHKVNESLSAWAQEVGDRIRERFGLGGT
jgi:hypothetical protein